MCNAQQSQKQPVDIAKANIDYCKKADKTPIVGKTIKEKADLLTKVFISQKAKGK